MVNKVAVIAIVAILAVPILIGFGMNLEPTTKTEYLADKDPVIVTELLQNDVGYSNVPANIYQLNSDFTTITGGDTPVSPVYNTISSNYSSFKYGKLNYTGGNHPYWGGANGTAFINWQYVYVQTDWFSGGHMNMKYMDQNNTLIEQVNRIHTFYFDITESVIHYTYYLSAINNDNLGYGEITVLDYTDKFAMIYDAGFVSNFISIYRQPADNSYANISDGYYFSETPSDLWAINLPERTSSALMTINLDSITTNSYNCALRTDPGVNLTLQKRVNSGVTSWQVKRGTTTIADLYYDQSRSDNTYQVLFQLNKVRSDFDDTNTAEYDYHVEFRYVGSWPTTIGEANYYQKYEYDRTFTQSSSNPEIYLDRIRIGYDNNVVNRTPTIRMDAGMYAGMEFPVISNNTYDPVAFKTNPSTTIKDISRYGNSIIFAGNTYTVDSSGNITLGIHKVSLNGIVLDSVPVAGGYDNRINGTTISTTAQPSTIRFSGQWVANISTDSQSTNTYQTTVWHAGEFAWDGMDQNFLIVGLITSLGVFIGLGIYARKSNSKGVIPLMIVCGSAAALFFVML